MPINPKQAQLTVILEALRALDYSPPDPLPETDKILEEVRDLLLEARDLLTEFRPGERPAPTEQERIEWLEFRCFEQRQLGLR